MTLLVLPSPAGLAMLPVATSPTVAQPAKPVGRPFLDAHPASGTGRLLNAVNVTLVVLTTCPEHSAAWLHPTPSPTATEVVTPVGPSFQIALTASTFSEILP